MLAASIPGIDPAAAVAALQPSYQHTKMGFAKMLRQIIFIALGSIMMGVGLELFLVPNQITDGGVTGISIILSHVTSVPLGVFLFLLNIPFLIMGYKQIGKTFALSTLLGVAVMSFSTALLHPVQPFTENTFLAAVFGGIILGIGVGLVIRFGGSLDGTEIVAILLNKKTPFFCRRNRHVFQPVHSVERRLRIRLGSAMYSLIAYYIAFKMIDITVEGLNDSKAVWIISENYKAIGDALLSRLGRGVTYMNGEGGFSGDEKKIIFTVITRLEEAKLKSIVEEQDPQAFLAIGNIHDVKGGRFKKKDIH